MSSVVNIFKVGVGPSSSHTVGPWVAAGMFLAEIRPIITTTDQYQIYVDLYGSLALTGKGHGTDFAVFMGLSGYEVDQVEEEVISRQLATFLEQQELKVGVCEVAFCPKYHIRFWNSEFLPEHPNGLTIRLINGEDEQILARTYFSTGGGFVATSDDLSRDPRNYRDPHPLPTTEEVRSMHIRTRMSLADIIMSHETHFRTESETRRALLDTAMVMLECAYHGCHTEGRLPGGLDLDRRAPNMHRRLNDGRTFDSALSWLRYIRDHTYSFRKTLEWISCIAIAVNEQNADFRKVVTAPTNGAAGVIPSVLLYMQALLDMPTTKEDIIHFLLVAGYIGQLYKEGATISAAAGGCQAEIGVSSSMAAGALTSVMGGTLDQVFTAAEIAMEHHLGLTCDPINGLVQIPCIERNSIGAIKAITAAELALERDPEKAKVSLDDVIKSMWETAQNMHHRYKETSLGGLAVNVSLPEC